MWTHSFTFHSAFQREQEVQKGQQTSLRVVLVHHLVFDLRRRRILQSLLEYKGNLPLREGESGAPNTPLSHTTLNTQYPVGISSRTRIMTHTKKKNEHQFFLFSCRSNILCLLCLSSISFKEIQ